jgi:hypothetical protein
MSFDLVAGENIILRAILKKKEWKRFRCCQCSCKIASSIYGAPCSLLYALFGGSCREKEANSFEMILTNQNLHFKQMLYQCGCCCQVGTTKTIPLDRIQDIQLISDYIGNCCKLVNGPDEVYQFHVQTAAMGIPIPEVSAYCIENPREFKKQVLEAKNKITMPTHIIGQSKTLDVQHILANPNHQQDVSRIINLLERQLHQPETQAPSYNNV